jgi:hypothetical protein
VQDGRFPDVERKRQVSAEVGQLRFGRREETIEVETRLAHRDHPIVPGHFDEPRPGVIADVCCVVRVDADRDVEPRKAVGQVEGALTRWAIPAGDEQSFDTCQAGSAEDEINVGIEAIRLEMAVTVDQSHGLRRGRDGVPGPRFDPAVLR